MDEIDPVVSERVGARMKQVYDAGKNTRKSFLETGDEINKYAYDKTYDFLYQDWDTGDGEAFFKAKVAKAAQFVEIVGPYIYQYNPTWTVTPKSFAYPECIARNKWEEEYLNWAAGEQDLYTQASRVVNEGLVYGRGVMWTGYNPRKNCVTHSYGSIKDLVIDPDAMTMDEANIKFRRRIKPRYELLQLYPKMEKMIRELPKATNLPSHLKASTTASGPQETGSDLLSYIEAYTRVGASRWMSDAQEAMGNDPAKIVMTEEGKIIDIGPWEIPFWRDDMWPCEELDFRELPGQVWPAAPMGPGLGFVKALNWLHTLYMSKMRVTTRTPLIVMKRNGVEIEKDQLVRLLKGSQMDTLVITVNGNEQYKISDLVEQFKYDTGVAEFERFAAIMETGFERATGLESILFAGNTNTQIRTAEDAKLKDRNSRTRIDHMKTMVEKFATRLGRKGRLAARYLETPEDITKIFGPQAGQEWGFLAPPEVVQQQRMMQQQTEQSNQQMAQMIPQLQAAGIPVPPPRPIPPVTAVDFDNWILESDVGIESGSMRKLDHDQQIDATNAAMNQAFPAMMQASHERPELLAPALHILSSWAKANAIPQEAQDAIAQAIKIASVPPPPPPMPMGPPPSGPINQPPMPPGA